jgi:para-nitrobenzyl esterase
MSENKQDVVNTKSGKVEGQYQEGLYVFKGIPYAAPPVGDLRWLPPQPVKHWDSVRPAGEYGAISPQNAMAVATPGSPTFEGQPQSEDCLFLNIWTPGLDDTRRPVIFWIHGGAFIIGAGSESFMDDGILARRGDVVVVSINYRLGALGFMNLKEITGGKIPATGNEGLLDQVAALDWVHDNIASFGGDPDNITVAGFSAGGMSIGSLLGMPMARGKFHKAINRSGAANVISTLDDAVKIAEQYLNTLKIDVGDIDALRNLSVKQLLDAQEKLAMKLREAEYRVTPFQPVVDGQTLPEWPIEAIKKGSAKNVTIMAGNSMDELKVTYMMDPAVRNMDEAGMIKRLSELLPPDRVPGLADAYRDALKKRGSGGGPGDILGTITTDIMFRMATIMLVEAQRDNGVPAYNYLFTYKSPAMGGVLGAMHGLDNPFLFGCLDTDFSGSGPEQESLALKIQDSCIAFARTGNPSYKSIGEWPVYGKDRRTMILDKNTRVEVAPYEAERAIWDEIELTHTRPM